MMNDYRSRLKTSEEALSVVRSGQRVYVHNGCAEPEILVNALVQRASELHNVEILHMATFGRAAYADPQFEGHFRHRGLFLAGNVRQAVQEGRADYVPIFLHEIENLIRSGDLPIDVALLQCSPPDRNGYMSLGTSVYITHAVIDQARHVIVKINDQAPRTFGDSFVHVSRVHAFTEASHPLVEYKSHEITGAHRLAGRRGREARAAVVAELRQRGRLEERIAVEPAPHGRLNALPDVPVGVKALAHR